MDTIADMLTRIRNVLLLKREEVVLPYSKFKHELAVFFEKQGWLKELEVLQSPGVKSSRKFASKKLLRLKLKYTAQGEPAISGLKKVSKPGQRIYARAKDLAFYRLGAGVSVVSTSKGLLSEAEARRQKLGGEVICQVW